MSLYLQNLLLIWELSVLPFAENVDVVGEIVDVVAVNTNDREIVVAVTVVFVTNVVFATNIFP